MRSFYCAAGVTLLACNLAGFAETRIPCGQTMDHPLQSRMVLVIDSKPAGLQIVGADQDAIHISCTAGSDASARDVAFHFSPTTHGGTLSIESAHLHDGDNNLEVKIEVPRRTNLNVHMFAGEIRVEGVKGDKDIELGAGQIKISSIHDGDYRELDASVSIGAIQAGAFGVNKGGFFRSLNRTNSSGDYRLRAHVTTGEIDLLGKAEQRDEGAKPD